MVHVVNDAVYREVRGNNRSRNVWLPFYFVLVYAAAISSILHIWCEFRGRVTWPIWFWYLVNDTLIGTVIGKVGRLKTIY